jgi:hypothetical protein
MRHTDGPWWACPPDEDSENWEIEDGYGHTATVYGDDEPAAANARLMAAAPELLAALRELVHYDEGSSEQGSYGYEVLSRCKAAIAKAEGRE